MRGFAQPTTYVVTIMKNFLTALASALLVAVIVTSLHYFVFSNDMDRAPLSLFVLSFLGMAAVALFNVRLSALRSGLGAQAQGSVPAATHSTPQNTGGRSSRGAGRNSTRDNKSQSGGSGTRNRGGNKSNSRGGSDARDAKDSKPAANRSTDNRSGAKPSPKDAQPASSAPSGSAGSAAAAAPIPDGPRETGTVKWFNRSKGFGFIIRPNGEEIFVHHRSIRNADESRRSNLRDGQDVNYIVADHTKGQQAEDVVGE